VIFPLKEPRPEKCLVMAMSRIELPSSEYSLSELYCFRRFAFLCALGFSGLALKAAGVRFYRDEMRVLLSSSSSDSASESVESCLSACSCVIAL